MISSAYLAALLLVAVPQAELASKSEQAKQAMANRHYSQAVGLYRELVRALPNNSGMRLNLGLALYSAGEYAEALSQFQQAVRLDSKNQSARLMAGLSFLKLEKPDQAVAPLEAVLKQEPQNRVALLELGDAYLGLAKFHDALRNFQNLTRLEPASAKAWQGLGLSYVGLSRRLFDAIETAAPDSAYWYYLLARARLRQQRYRSAFHLYREVLVRDPFLPGVHAAIAEIYRNTGHPDWAEEEERRGGRAARPDCSRESLHCDYLNREFEKILRNSRQGSPEELFWSALAASDLALQAFSQLHRLPPSAELHELAAEAYRIQDLHVFSIREWRQALKLSPGDSRLERNLARSLVLNAEFGEAESLLRSILKKEPHSTEAHHLLGEALLGQHRFEEAYPHLREAVNKAPTLLPAQALLGEALAKLNRWKEAVPQLRAALPLDQDGSLHYLLARTYQALNMPAESGEMMARSRRLSESAQARRDQFNEEFQITPPG